MTQECRPLKTFTTLSMIWAVSLMCSLPLFLGRTIVNGRHEIEEKIPFLLRKCYDNVFD